MVHDKSFEHFGESLMSDFLLFFVCLFVCLFCFCFSPSILFFFFFCKNWDIGNLSSNLIITTFTYFFNSHIHIFRLGPNKMVCS